MIDLVSGQEIIISTYAILQITLLVSCFLTQQTVFESSVYKDVTSCVRRGKYPLQLGRSRAQAFNFLLPNTADRVRDHLS
jgi:hypothetical protein